ncbi:MAG: class I SAM-dependent methyltransferase [Candidatus Omnitrophota bacterium]|nr:MAG: class I SAM-dependent methyltransferase [Candidatus Omnitrophota bacterium]
MSKSRHHKTQDTSWIWLLAIVGVCFVLFTVLLACGSLRHDRAITRITPTIATQAYQPPTLRSLIVNPESEVNYFDFLLDTGDRVFEDERQLEPEVRELINYFFLGITLPPDEFWVNLNPIQPDKIVSPRLGITDMGRVLLEADLQLKKDSSKITDPRTSIGKEYWQNLNERLQKQHLTTIQVPTSTRVWIIPGKAKVQRDGDKITIVEAKLKVCLESEYLSRQGYNSPNQVIEDCSSSAFKEVILPKLEEEVNFGKDYAPLRQVYNSLILAQCYKQRYCNKNNFYSQSIHKARLVGLCSEDDWEKDKYFQAYLNSHKQGEYSFSRQEYDPNYLDLVRRRYFSGGVNVNPTEIPIEEVKIASSAVVGQEQEQSLSTEDNLILVSTFANVSSPITETKVVKQGEELNEQLAGEITIQIKDKEYKIWVDPLRESTAWIQEIDSASRPYSYNFEDKTMFFDDSGELRIADYYEKAKENDIGGFALTKDPSTKQTEFDLFKFSRRFPEAIRITYIPVRTREKLITWDSDEFSVESNFIGAITIETTLNTWIITPNDDGTFNAFVKPLNTRFENIGPDFRNRPTRGEPTPFRFNIKNVNNNWGQFKLETEIWFAKNHPNRNKNAGRIKLQWTEPKIASSSPLNENIDVHSKQDVAKYWNPEIRFSSPASVSSPNESPTMLTKAQTSLPSPSGGIDLTGVGEEIGPVSSPATLEARNEVLSQLAGEYDLDPKRLDRIIPEDLKVTEKLTHELEILSQLTALANRKLEYSLQRGRLARGNKPIYEVLQELFIENMPKAEGEHLAQILARMNEGSLETAYIFGVLLEKEKNILIKKDAVAFSKMSKKEKQDFVKRLKALVESYDTLAKTFKEGAMRRLLPLDAIALLGGYFDLAQSMVLDIILKHSDFLEWLPKADSKVVEIKDRVGGSANAWSILRGQGLDGTDAWLKKAEPKATQIQDRVGGPAKAWRIIIKQGPDGVDSWLKKAEPKVITIQKRVGGSSNAWNILIIRGLDKVDSWLKKAEPKVVQIKDRVGGLRNAWKIVIRQGLDKVDSWLKKAEAKVVEIKDRVGGSTNAWQIVINQGLDETDNAQGLDKVDSWLKKAEAKVVEIKDRVGGSANAWQIVIGQGLSVSISSPAQKDELKPSSPAQPGGIDLSGVREKIGPVSSPAEEISELVKNHLSNETRQSIAGKIEELDKLFAKNKEDILRILNDTDNISNNTVRKWSIYFMQGNIYTPRRYNQNNTKNIIVFEFGEKIKAAIYYTQRKIVLCFAELQLQNALLERILIDKGLDKEKIANAFKEIGINVPVQYLDDAGLALGKDGLNSKYYHSFPIYKLDYIIKDKALHSSDGDIYLDKLRDDIHAIINSDTSFVLDRNLSPYSITSIEALVDHIVDNRALYVEKQDITKQTLGRRFLNWIKGKMYNEKESLSSPAQGALEDPLKFKENQLQKGAKNKHIDKAGSIGESPIVPRGKDTPTEPASSLQDKITDKDKVELILKKINLKIDYASKNSYQLYKRIFAEGDPLTVDEHIILLSFLWERNAGINLSIPDSLKKKIVKQRNNVRIDMISEGKIEGSVIKTLKINLNLSYDEERFLWQIFHRKYPSSSNKNYIMVKDTIMDNMIKKRDGKIKVLDIGCGPKGMALERLKDKYDNQIEAFGISIEITDRSNKSITLIEGDIKKLHLYFEKDLFDLIYESQVLMYLQGEELRIVMNEIMRALRPGGGFVIDEGLHSVKEIKEVLNSLDIAYEVPEGQPLVIKKESQKFSSPLEEKAEGAGLGGIDLRNMRINLR